jgi:hypothetical protein
MIPRDVRRGVERMHAVLRTAGCILRLVQNSREGSLRNGAPGYGIEADKKGRRGGEERNEREKSRTQLRMPAGLYRQRDEPNSSGNEAEDETTNQRQEGCSYANSSDESRAQSAAPRKEKIGEAAERQQWVNLETRKESVISA